MPHEISPLDVAILMTIDWSKLNEREGTMELIGHLFEDSQYSYKLLPVTPGNKYPHNPLWDGSMAEIRRYLQDTYGKRRYRITSTRDADHGGFEVYASI